MQAAGFTHGGFYNHFGGLAGHIEDGGANARQGRGRSGRG
jgi:hypothetical protein